MADGEFMILVGPSGCGKTTAMRMVAGLEEITSGTLRINGEIMNDVSPRDRDIAMVFQNYALYPHMTVYKNMAFGLQLRNYPKAEIDSRVREAAQILGLTRWINVAAWERIWPIRASIRCRSVGSLISTRLTRTL